VRRIGILEAEFRQVLGKGGEVVHLESQVREVGLHLDRAAAGKMTNLDQLFALGRLEKDELRTARRAVPPDFLEPEHFAVKFDRPFKIVDPVPGMQKFFDACHGGKITRGRRATKAEFRVSRIKPLAAERRLGYAKGVFHPVRRVAWPLMLLLLGLLPVQAQVDPVRRELVQLGYNQTLVGHAPLSGYAFYYRNQPGVIRSNWTLRLAVAPVYLDSELGIRQTLTPHTDLGLGLAGGGFADSYNEIRGGNFRSAESFTGHGGEVSASLYHCFNPTQRIPLYGVVRAAAHYSFYDRDHDTAAGFAVPHDQATWSLRSGLRWGGGEPVIFPALAMELSLWHEWQHRTEPGRYGFQGDRALETDTHLFWGRALLAYTLPECGHYFSLSLTAGGSASADRLNAYRLGAILPLVSEFALTLPGYYYQEISADRFVLMSAAYLFPLDHKQRWHLAVMGAVAAVDYLPGLEQAGHWHRGVGGGLFYRAQPWQVMVGYGYGVDAIRSHGRGAHSVGVLVQIDLDKTLEALLGPPSPFRSRGLFRLFRGW